jgi:hypothetical protein
LRASCSPKNMRRTLLNLFFIFYVAGALAYTFAFLSIPNIHLGSDAISFLAGAEILKERGGEFLYNGAIQFAYQRKIVSPLPRTWLLPFRSPPIVAAAFIPFTHLGVHFTFFFMIFLKIAIMAIFAYFGSKIFKNIKRSKLFLLAILYFPFTSALVFGQFSPLLVLLFLFIFNSARQKKYYSAGALSGLLLVKPQLFLFMPFLFFVIPKKKDFIKGLLSCSVILFLLNVYISGSAFLFDYPKFLLATETYSFGSRPYQMFSLFGTLKFIFPRISNLVLVIINFFLYFVVLIYFQRFSKKFSLERTFAVGIILTILFSVHALSHDLVILLIPIFILLNHYWATKREPPKIYLTLALLLFFLPIPSIINAAALGTGLLLLSVAFLLFKDKSYLGKISASISPTGR